jgi:hypothetical protein
MTALPAILPILEVTWRDAAGEGGWRPAGELTAVDLDTVTSVGYLIHSNRRRLVLLQSRQASGEQGADTLAIPVSCIVRRRQLR